MRFDDKAGYMKGNPKDNYPERFPHNPKMDAISRLVLRRDELQATADRRLKLLRRMPEWEYDFGQECYFCPICGNNKDYGHSKDCELAEELGDD